MSIPFSRLKKSRKLENAIFASILLFLFRIIFPTVESLYEVVINESILFIVIYFWLLYSNDFIHLKVTSPLSIILNAGILNAIIFFIISVSASITSQSSGDIQIDFIYSIFVTFLAFVFIGTVVYILSAFCELFYLRQKKDPSSYINTMLTFFALTFFSNILIKADPSFDYPKNAFFVVSIILISINSLRVAWIAFLPKRQKVYLLVISVVLSILFGLNFALSLEVNQITQIISSFSPGLLSLLNLVMIYGAIYFGVIFFTTLFHLPTAEAFDRKAEEVSSLMDLSKLITQVFDFKELADTVTNVTTKVCNSDSAWLVTKTSDDWELSSVNNIGYVEADKVTHTILAEYSYHVDEVITLNQHPIKIKIKTDVRTFNFQSIAIAPLKVHEEISGYLFSARKQDYGYDEDDIKAVEAFADYAAVALENAKLIKKSIDKERMEKELDVAREIQYKILPLETPKYDKLEISALFIPAFEVGGDYYDFFDLGNDKLGFVVADVSGKGISAAFVMAEVKGIFESLAKILDDSKELLVKANEILKDSLDKKTFVTAVYGVFDIKKGKVNFARAGHPPILYLTDQKMERFTPSGMGLGLEYSENFEKNLEGMEIQLKNNDILTFYTDGIPESQNDKMQEFGYDKFERIVKKNSSLKLDEIANEVMKEVSLFSKDNSQHDDITLVLFKWNSNKQKSGEK